MHGKGFRGWKIEERKEKRRKEKEKKKKSKAEVLPNQTVDRFLHHFSC